MNNRRKQLMLASAREYCKCVVEGKTLKYNQIVKNGNFEGTSEWTSSAGTFSASDNICSFDATAQNGDIRTIVYYDIVVGHKYLVYAEIKTTTATNNGAALYFGYSSPDRIGYVPSNTEWNAVCGIKQATSQGNSYLVFIRDFRASNRDTIYIRNVMCVDLTMLGLESITNTSDFFATDLGKYIVKGNYLPYEPNGKFIHAQSPINFKGVNLWNEQWKNGYYATETKTFVSDDSWICSKNEIKVRPNTQYFIKCSYYNVIYFFNDDTYIDSVICSDNGFTTPYNCNNILFMTNIATYHNDICINEYNENYNGKYYKYCGNSVFESCLTLYKGDTYKTYSIDSVEYNELLETTSFANISSSSLLNVFNVVANHKYLFVQKYSRECEYPYEDRDYQVYFYGDNIEAEYNVNVRGNFIYEPNASDTCTLRVETYSEFGTPINFSIMLIDLTALGLTNVNSVADFNKTKLGMFLSKGYYLPYTTTTKTIKDQIVRTFKEVDLSTLTWAYISSLTCHTADLDSDLTDTNAITEKYNEYTGSGFPPLNHFKLVSGAIVINTGSSTQPSGKALIKLLQPTLVMWQTLDIENYNEFVEIDPHIFKLNRDLSDYGVLDVTSDTGTKQANLTMLNIAGGYGDFCYQDGYIYQKTDDIESVWIYQIQISNAPSRMVSRRTINVESENGIDMDFTKE